MRPICSTTDEKWPQQESRDWNKPNLFHWISVRAMTATNNCITKKYRATGDLQDWTLQKRVNFVNFVRGISYSDSMHNEIEPSLTSSNQ